MKPVKRFDPVPGHAGAATPPDFQVVIAYADVGAGQRAMNVFNGLAHNLHGEVKLLPQPWRFEFLEDPDWYSAAMADAIKADMLIISTATGSELTPTAESWIKMCLARKRGTSAAVVALLGHPDHPEDANPDQFDFMQSAAVEAGLDFFTPCRQRHAASVPNAGLRRRRARKAAQTREGHCLSFASRWNAPP